MEASVLFLLPIFPERVSDGGIPFKYLLNRWVIKSFIDLVLDEIYDWR